jgi:hypothetical protein
VADVLEQRLESFRTVQARLKKATAKSYSWSELTEDEKAVYEYAQELVVAAGVCTEIPSARIVDFNDPILRGLAEGGTIQISRKCLADKHDYLGTMIHEIAHAQTGAGDGEHAHVAAIEAYWIKVFVYATRN